MSYCESISCSLLSLLGLEGLELPVSAALGSLGTRFGVQHPVPPGKAGRVVADEFLVVYIVVVSTGPEGQDMPQAPGEVVSAVRIDSLE